MPKLDDQLKTAIAKMPVKEKDKLLLRLVAKDKKLVNRLIFELLEGGETRDDRAVTLQKEMAADITKQQKYDFFSPGYLLMMMRFWNARITEHVQTTKDKVGEVSLTFFLLAESFRVHRPMLDKYPARRSDTLAPYVIKRAESILKKAEKIHEDYRIELREDAQTMLDHIWSFPPTAALSAQSSLPRYWEI